MKKTGKKSLVLRSLYYVVFTFTVISVPFLYQNCGSSDFTEHHSTSPPPLVDIGIGAEVRNGAGTLISSGGSLCSGNVNDAQSSSVTISITTFLSANTLYCRQVSPQTDNEFWDCENAEELSNSSSGSFAWSSGTDNAQAELSYNDLSDGTYELEISAEGQGEGDSVWTTPAISVSFVVEDCNSVTLPSEDPPEEPTTTSTTTTTTTTTSTTTTTRPTTTTTTSTTTTTRPTTTTTTSTTTTQATGSICDRAASILQTTYSCNNRPEVTNSWKGQQIVEQLPWYMYSIDVLCQINWGSDVEKIRAYNIRKALDNAGCDMSTRIGKYDWKHSRLWMRCQCESQWANDPINRFGNQ